MIQLEFTSDASPVTTACSLFHSRAEVLATVNISFDVYLYLEKASWSKFKRKCCFKDLLKQFTDFLASEPQFQKWTFFAAFPCVFCLFLCIAVAMTYHQG